MSFPTPYYRTINNASVYECAEEPDVNYSPYTLFCFNSKIIPSIHQYLRDIPDIDTRLISSQTDDKMHLTLSIIKITSNIDEVLTLNERQRTHISALIDRFTSDLTNTCVLIPRDKIINLPDGTPIPPAWTAGMLPYINFNGVNVRGTPLTDLIDPFVDELGLQADLSRYPDYLSAYNEITGYAIRQLQRRYLEGYILDASSISEAWSLEPVDNEGRLFRPNWSDSRFANRMVDFLLSRIDGDKYITLTVGANKVRRHFISVAMTENRLDNDYYFQNDTLKVSVNNLFEARSISAIVETTISKAVGVVSVYDDNADIIGDSYTTYNIDRKRVYSVLTDIDQL